METDMTAGSDRLVSSPVFVLSTMRSGSTLLRVLLNSHSMIHAPHELHLRTIEVTFTEFYTPKALRRLGLDGIQLEYLLWDRMLHRELTRSGKQIIVDKTPGNALVWRRLQECWPDARYIFLLRHPASILSSLEESARTQWKTMTDVMLGNRPAGDDEGFEPYDAMLKTVLEHAQGVEEARHSLGGHTVRYEELISRPDEIVPGICEFLGVPWEPGMLEYGQHDHGPFEVFIGDFTEKIRSGVIREGRPLPDLQEVPEELRSMCRAWGYADGDA